MHELSRRYVIGASGTYGHVIRPTERKRETVRPYTHTSARERLKIEKPTVRRTADARTHARTVLGERKRGVWVGGLGRKGTWAGARGDMHGLAPGHYHPSLALLC